MRDGTELTARGRAVPFSFWPTSPTIPRPSVQSLLFAIDPWVIMRRAIIDSFAAGPTRDEALAYIAQAGDFFASAQASSIEAAKPVQLYYCYLNIAKAFILCRGRQLTLPRIQHGIAETVSTGGREFSDGIIQVRPSPSGGRLQAYDEFMGALGDARIVAGQHFPVAQLLPQILSGHRLWAAAEEVDERFIALQRVEFVEGAMPRRAWVRMYLFADDVARLGYTQADLVQSAGLSPAFRSVRCTEAIDNRHLHCIEQSIPVPFIRHGLDAVPALVTTMKRRLWMTVSTMPPYRRYYLYLCPAAERPNLISQLASIYCITFYLGSVTRYRPNAFQSLLDGKLGPRIAEFVSGQPAQFVYLMASEFVRRDVTRPSIV